MDPNVGASVFTPRQRQLVETAPVARLATVRPDGSPHLVPVTFALHGAREVVTAVDHKPKRTLELQRLRNIEANPQVCLLIDHYTDDWADDWAQLWWVRLDGVARVVRAEPDRSAYAEVLARKYPAYAATPPAGPVIVVDVRSVAEWASQHPE